MCALTDPPGRLAVSTFMSVIAICLLPWLVQSISADPNGATGYHATWLPILIRCIACTFAPTAVSAPFRTAREEQAVQPLIRTAASHERRTRGVLLRFHGNSVVLPPCIFSDALDRWSAPLQRTAIGLLLHLLADRPGNLLGLPSC
jgi:hypothetical protein